MYQLYCFNRISRSERVAWTLNELGQDYVRIELDPLSNEHKDGDYLHVNPYGKVPALYDGERLQTESAAICTSLAEKHSDKGLIPPTGTSERGEYYQWVFFCMTELEPEIWSLHKHMVIYPKEQKSAKAVQLARSNYQKAIRVFADHMHSRQYVVGEAFSVADIIIGFNLIWASRYKLLTDHSELDDYLRMIRLRPRCPSVLQQEP